MGRRQRYAAEYLGVAAAPVGAPLAGLRSVWKILLAQGALFEDPSPLPRGQDK